MNLVTLKDEVSAARDRWITWHNNYIAVYARGVGTEDVRTTHLNTIENLRALNGDRLTNEELNACHPDLPAHDFSPTCSECGEKKPSVVKVGPDYDPGDYEVGAVEEVWVCRECLVKALALIDGVHA